MSEAKELARAIAFELSEHFLEIAGDDYRELFLERKIHLAAINELEKQLGEANARIAELEAENAGLKERVAMLDVTAVYKSLGEMGYIEQVDRLTARIAELEASIDQLIKVGRAVTSVAEWRYANLTELLAWDTLVDNIYKEREK